jgi:hypothetical protein
LNANPTAESAIPIRISESPLRPSLDIPVAIPAKSVEPEPP